MQNLNLSKLYTEPKLPGFGAVRIDWCRNPSSIPLALFLAGKISLSNLISAKIFLLYVI
jgi:hypothetical protein